MKPAKPQESAPGRHRRLLATITPIINSVVMGVSYVAGGAGVAASVIDEDGVTLVLSALLLAAAVELYIGSRPQAE